MNKLFLLPLILVFYSCSSSLSKKEIDTIVAETILQDSEKIASIRIGEIEVPNEGAREILDANSGGFSVGVDLNSNVREFSRGMITALGESIASVEYDTEGNPYIFYSEAVKPFMYSKIIDDKYSFTKKKKTYFKSCRLKPLEEYEYKTENEQKWVLAKFLAISSFLKIPPDTVILQISLMKENDTWKGYINYPSATTGGDRIRSEIERIYKNN